MAVRDGVKYAPGYDSASGHVTGQIIDINGGQAQP